MTAAALADTRLRFDRRCVGHAGTLHAGYLAGLLAAPVRRSAVAVHWLAPVHRRARLAYERRGETVVLLADGAEAAEAIAALPGLIPPAPPSLTNAASASQTARARLRRTPTDCRVCGGDDDGLRVHAGPAPGRPEIVAALWVPPGYDGEPLAGALAWPALDCTARAAAGGRSATSRLCVETLAPLSAGRPHTVIGWIAGRAGPQLRAGAAIHDARGELAARAELTLAGA